MTVLAFDGDGVLLPSFYCTPRVVICKVARMWLREWLDRYEVMLRFEADGG